MAKTKTLSPAERLEAFHSNMLQERPTILRGQNAVSACSALLDGVPCEMVSTGHSGFPVTDPQGRVLQRGERFSMTAQMLPRYAKSIELGRLLPAVQWDASQKYDQARGVWEEDLQPRGVAYGAALKELDKSRVFVIAARGALEAAEERLRQAEDAAARAEGELTQMLDQHGL